MSVPFREWDRGTKIVFVILVIGMMLTLASCGGGVATETHIQIEKVPVRAKCPDAGTYNGLVAARPKPLREQPMPATPDERVAKTVAQLGRYEASGGWADRVSAALDRCQEGEDLTAKP